MILELSGEIVWKANGGWMEGMTVCRPKLVTGVTPTYEVLRLDNGGRLDIWHCVFDNRGSIGNCVSIAGTGGGTWERVSIHGASDGFSGLLVGQSARLQLIDVSSAHKLVFSLTASLFLIQFPSDTRKSVMYHPTSVQV